MEEIFLNQGRRQGSTDNSIVSSHSQKWKVFCESLKNFFRFLLVMDLLFCNDCLLLSNQSVLQGKFSFNLVRYQESVSHAHGYKTAVNQVYWNENGCNKDPSRLRDFSLRAVHPFRV